MQQTNAKFASADSISVVFARACKLAGIPPTRRQASKWRMHKGLARLYVNQAKAVLAKEARA